MTLSQFLSYVNQLPRIRRWEAGAQIDGKKDLSKMTTKELGEAIVAGEVTKEDLEAHSKKNQKYVPVEQRGSIEAKIKQDFGMTRQKEMFFGRI